MEIVPSSRPGESDIEVDWRQRLPLRASLFVDDSGSEGSGKYQGGFTLSLDHGLMLNDLFYVTVYSGVRVEDGDGERQSTGYVTHYSLPYDYWLLSFTHSNYEYWQSVAGINQTYEYSGRSRNSQLEVERVLFRNAKRKSSVSLRGYLKTSNNYIDDTEIEVQRRRMSGMRAAISHREFVGKGTLDLEWAYRWGTEALDALPAPEEAFGEGTARPEITTAELKLRLPFQIGRQALNYSTLIRLQWNHTPLIPQDRFAIGGRHTVRGFSGERVLSAERGVLMRNELGLSLNQYIELYLGLDGGVVDGPTAELLAGQRLIGAALGLRGRFGALQYDLFAGVPVKKPTIFPVDDVVTGFNLNWTF